VIRLGSLAGYSFEGPWLLGGWTPPDQPGIFAVMYKPAPDTKGDTYAEVGKALGIALGTVQAHVRRIYEKLEISSKAEAAVVAVKLGFV